MRLGSYARFRGGWGVVVGSLLVAGILACAGSTQSPSGDSEWGGTISDVQVESSPVSSIVTLVGPQDPVFTAFQQSEPDRLVVDLAGVEPALEAAPVAVYDGLVDEILISPFDIGSGDKMTRVEISLASAVEYEIQHSSEGVEIILASVDADLADDDPLGGDESDPWLGADADAYDSGEFGLGRDDGMEDVANPGALAQPVAPVDVRPASLIRAVSARRLGDGVLVYVEGDGSVESATTFTLKDPARLVVDLPALRSEISDLKIDVGAPLAERVRLGVHSDKVRIVVDAGPAEAPFDGRRVLPVPSGLVLALGANDELEQEVVSLMGTAAPLRAVEPEGEALAQAAAGEPFEAAAELSDMGLVSPIVLDEEVPANASEEESPVVAEQVPAAPATAAPVTIYGVEFDAQSERDRIVVLGEQPVDYLVYEPDPETVVLSIEGAVIDPEAAVRIAPEPAGSVSLVTAFDQPEAKTAEVRVVVKRAANLKPEVSRRGSLLIMDFPRTGALAATPPVFEAPQTTTLSPAGQDAGILPAAPAPGGVARADALPAPLAPAPDLLPVALPPDDFGALPASAPAPAAIDPPASISILHEGGLMDGKEYVGRRISLDFKDVQIADVLRLIAEVSDLNVIAGDEVSGAVTIRLVDVPWDQALDVILLTKGLGFVRIGNVLRIAPTELLAQEEELRLQERRAKEKLEDLVVKLQPVNYADVKEISAMVKQLLTPRGSVNTDDRTNTLIIKDIASVIDEATALIKAVDTMTPQVMIEAKIVEANLDFSRELGSQWIFGTNPLTESTLGSNDFMFFPGEDDGIGDGFGNSVIFGNPITSGSTGLLNLAAHVLDEKFNVELQLQAAEANGEGEVISSPRVVTIDNSEAKIEQGVSIPFQTFENGNAQLEFVDAVLSLRVTPHITSDSSIIMDIEVSRNAPDDSVFTLTGSPAIAKNQVTTETLVKDGQTLVLGGIYVVDKAERESRTPFLHKIPFLGNAFRSNEFRDSRQELLIFVTPRVVQPASAAS